MIYIAGHNIYTALGFGSPGVYSRVRAGETALARQEGAFGVPEPFVASLIDRSDIDRRFGTVSDDLTHIEKAMILSAQDAIRMSGIDPSSSDTLFIISSTKGNIDMLEAFPDGKDPRITLWHSALAVTSYFGNANVPVCVSNACTSGVCAQIAAQRAIEVSGYRHVVVIGADFLSKFIVSGFQSLKALSPERCRPFDKDRTGLNLSEAVATIVFSAEGRGLGFALENGCIRNDANHISAPSRTGVGQIAAIEGVVSKEVIDDIAFVNVHGTATNYNDAMESVALHGCGLDHLSAVSYKSVFGHTLGAAGVLETIISCLALDEGIVLPTVGYSECGVPFPLSVSAETRPVRGGRFLKIMSGFGGINAAAIYRKI